jgi:hypothetical protein
VWERIAARFVAGCCVADAAGACLPMPPTSTLMHAVTLPVSTAWLVQAHTRAGEILRAVQLCNGIEPTAPPVSSQSAPGGGRLLHAAEWDAYVESRWRDELQSVQLRRDALRAQADLAHGTFLEASGLRCVCAEHAFWHCCGEPIVAGGDAAALADQQMLVGLDESQGVDDELRDAFGKVHARVDKLNSLLTWASHAKATLTDPEACCAVTSRAVKHDCARRCVAPPALTPLRVCVLVVCAGLF